MRIFDTGDQESASSQDKTELESSERDMQSQYQMTFQETAQKEWDGTKKQEKKLKPHRKYKWLFLSYVNFILRPKVLDFLKVFSCRS